MKKLVIIHILPLEYYPPVTNLIGELEKSNTIETQVYTVHNTNSDLEIFKSKKVKIVRTPYFAHTTNRFKKLYRLLQSVLVPLFLLLKQKPDVLLYFEPHSALPAYLYKKYFNTSVKLCIHYHEYYTPKDFLAAQMQTVRFFHNKEVNYLYKHAHWISQTNADRIGLFAKDYPFVKPEQLHVLANYPPRDWGDFEIKKNKSSIIKLVYVGALSFENTYIKEVIDFVKLHPERLFLAIYSYNMHDDVCSYLSTLHEPNVTVFEGGIPYEQLPKVLRNYDIGLVLYKGHNTNYLYNAPNKLFEYLVCGLHVWFPKDLRGCWPYSNIKTRPIVKAVDFKNLEPSLMEDYYNSLTLPFITTNYSCETELQPLIRALNS